MRFILYSWILFVLVVFTHIASAQLDYNSLQNERLKIYSEDRSFTDVDIMIGLGLLILVVITHGKKDKEILNSFWSDEMKKKGKRKMTKKFSKKKVARRKLKKRRR